MTNGDNANPNPELRTPNLERRTQNPSEYNAIRIDSVPRPRFHAPGLDPSQGETILPEDESHHLVRVMRLAAGDEIAVFDGSGREFQARVVRADRKGVTVAIGDPIVPLPEPAVPMVLVQSVLKGDKMDGVVRDATMAGVARIVPVVAERSLLSVAALGRSHAHERWQRVAIASAKQCRRARLPVIGPARPLREWLEAPFEGRRLLLVEPSADADGVQPIRAALAGPAPAAVACLVGPEGGWSAAERAAAVSAGCALASLGQMTLRADAVGLVAVSIVNFMFDE